jgi:GTPase SAR1 family protein
MVMLVYDVTNSQSFQNLGLWLDLVRKNCPEKMLPGVVVANKIDLEDRLRVDLSEGQEFAKGNNLEFVQVSAQRNTTVETAFETLSQMFYTAYEVPLRHVTLLRPSNPCPLLPP